MSINKTSVLSFSLFPLVLLFVYSMVSVPKNFYFFLTNFLILLISYCGMLYQPYKYYTLSKVVFFFFFFFFGIIPLNDEYNGNLYWGGSYVAIEYKITTNVLILLGLVTFFVCTLIRFRFLNFSLKRLPDLNSFSFPLFGVLFISLVIYILSIFDFNLMNMMVRSYAGSDAFSLYGRLGQVAYLLFGNFVRILPLILFLLLCNYYFNNKSSFRSRTKLFFGLSITISFVLTLLVISPLSIPRFQAAALYIPFVIIFTSYWERPYGMLLFLFGGLLFIFPILDKFRNFDFENFDFNIDFSYMNSGHFDGYQNFVRVVENDIITLGSNLLGALFFFIPRSLWESKPIGSGAFLADTVNLSFNNIAMPFIAEGYVSFGILGIILFMSLAGIFIGSFDRYAWKLKLSQISHVFLIYYYLLFGMVFFIMRGDLMSSYSYTVGLTFSFWGSVFILKFASKLRM